MTLLYIPISSNIPEILGMPVHDEFCGRKYFHLLLIQIGQELTLQGFSVRHFSAFLWSRHRKSCKESVHSSIPRSPCAPGPPAHPKACLSPLPYPAASGLTKISSSSGHGKDILFWGLLFDRRLGCIQHSCVTM